MGDIRRAVRLIVVACGLGCSLAWVNVLFGGVAPYALERADMAGYVLSERLYAITTMAAGLGRLAVICLKGGRVPSFLLTWKIGIAAVATMSFCAAMILIMSRSGQESPLLYACAIVSGIAWAALGLRWNGLLLALPLGDALLLILCGIAAGVVFTLPFPFSSVVLNGVCAAVFPLASFALLGLSEKKCGLIPASDYYSASDSFPVGMGKGNDAMVVRIALYALFVCFASRIPRAALVALGRDFFGGQFFVGTSEVLPLLFAAVAASALAAGMLLPQKRVGLVVFYKLVFFLLLMGMLLTFLGGGLLSVPLYFFNSAIYQLVRILVWSIAVAYGRWRPERAFSVYCASTGCLCVGLSVGMLLGSSSFISAAVGFSAGFAGFVIVGALIVAAVHIFIFTETDVRALRQCFSGKNRLSFRQKCSLVSDGYALSERESQVLYLIATGRDITYMQQVLNISKSTISTHRAHIYAKLDIHSKQELIDLVESTAEKGEVQQSQSGRKMC